MSEFEIRLQGTQIRINTDQSIDEIKNKFAESMREPIFNGVDTNENSMIDEGAELDTFKSNLRAQGYEIESEPSRAEVRNTNSSSKSGRAYNNAVQNMKNRYDSDELKNNFEQGEEYLHTIKKGDTLWAIAKKALIDEGLNPTNKAVNERIVQIAAINGINNVNNVPIGTNLVVKLNSAGINKVKAEETQNSAVAFGAASPVQPAQDKESVNNPVNTLSNGTLDNNQSYVEYSNVKLSKNVNLDDEGWTLSSNQDDVTGFDNLEDGESVSKYEKTENGNTLIKYQYECNDGGPYYLQADTIEELKGKLDKYNKAWEKIKDSEDGETEEAAAKRKSENLAAIKECLEAVDYNTEYVTTMIDYIKNYEYCDYKSDEFKAFVDDLIRTKNVDVLRAIIKDGNNNYNQFLINDKQSSEDIAGLYKEIRDKEKAGEKLNNDEIELKELLKGYHDSDAYYMYQIEEHTNDDGTKIYGKKTYFDKDGNFVYQNNSGIAARSAELLDEISAKIEAAEALTDESKKAEALQKIFNEYKNTDDISLVKTLANKASYFNATQEDLFELIDNNGLDVIYCIVYPENYTDEANKALTDKVISKYEEEFAKGDISNAVYLEDAFAWITLRGDVTIGEDSDEETTAVNDFKNRLVETFFTKTVTKETAENGDETDVTKYEFKPNRRPTYEEMSALLGVNLNQDQKNAIVDSIKLEDIGKGQYTRALNGRYCQYPLFSESIEEGRSYLNKHYAKLVEELNTPEEAIEFLNGIGAYPSMPFEEIFNKFGDDKEVQAYLLKTVEREESALSYENRIKLLKTVMTENSGKFTLNRSDLPEGVTMENLAQILPTDCKSGDAKKIFETLFDSLKFNDNKDESAACVLVEGHIYGKYDNNKKDKIKELFAQRGYDELYSELRNNCLGVWDNIGFTQEEVGKIFKQLGPKNKVAMIKAGHYKEYEKNGYYLAKKGDTIGKIMQDHLVKYYGFDKKDAERYVNRCTNYLKKAGFDKIEADTVVDLNRLPWQRFDGYRIGEMLFAEAKGAKVKDGTREILKSGAITKDNVVGVIEQFNSHTKETKSASIFGKSFSINNNDRIMTFLDWEAGPTKDEMNVIPKALLERAKEIGLEGNQAYKNLAAFVQEQSGDWFDYGPKDAEKMDNLIEELLGVMYQTGKNGYPL